MDMSIDPNSVYECIAYCRAPLGRQKVGFEMQVALFMSVIRYFLFGEFIVMVANANLLCYLSAHLLLIEASRDRVP